jgi:hypothetical protein
MWRDREY